MFKFTNKFNIFKTGKEFEGVAKSKNPFVREGLKDYCKYDRIEIINAEDELGGVIVRFYYGGEHYVSERVDNISFTNNSKLDITAEGRIKVTLN